MESELSAPFSHLLCPTEVCAVSYSPLIATLDTDSLNVQFVLSTNADDPAGITREKALPAKEDVKPRLSQARLSAIPRQSASVAPRANSTFQANNRSVASNRSQAGPGTAPSGSGSRAGKAPLFQPRDVDDEEGDTKPIITLDDDDDEDEEDAMWSQMDAAEPEFSQMAADLEVAMQSTQQQQKQQLGANSKPGSQGKDKEAESMQIDEEEEQDNAGVTEAALVEKQQQQEAPQEVIDMSLDVDDDSTMQEEELEQDESSRTKRRKKVSSPADRILRCQANVSPQNWQLGLT